VTVGTFGIGFVIRRLDQDRRRCGRIPALACCLTGRAQVPYFLAGPIWLWMAGS